MTHALFSIVVIAALLPPAALGATAIIGATKDNSIFQNNPTHTQGGGAGIFAGTNGMNSPRRALVAFDIAGNVPAGATITAVELTLYLGNAPNSDPQSIELHRLTKEWGEGDAGIANPSISMSGQGSPANDGDATWNDARSNIDPWTTAGALGDVVSTASASTIVGGPVDTPFVWNSTAALVSDVQSWLNSPATNYGWMLFNTNEATVRSLKAFYSKEATQDSTNLPNSLDPAWRPRLAVAYTAAASPSGDYNHNGVIDAADYVIWRKTLNSSASPAGSGADGNANGVIDNGDYTYWRERFGTSTAGFATAASVPEPGAAILLLMAVPLALLHKRR